ncbi:uncharacterized protein BJX67DRAFT_380153 [Aspergillus lucknowensis]|uniref:Peroxin/Ferlin domain-containing protein n=1 Tax=Aspergillus lucknowensis TaxID=176173 RepID=A0ABR4LY94_9EURO
MVLQLVDNTATAEQPALDTTCTQTTTTTGSGSRQWSRPPIRAGRSRRKYAKSQPARLGVADDTVADTEQPSSDERELIRAGTNTNTLTNANTAQETTNNGSQPPGQNAEHVLQQDFGAGAGTGTIHQSENHPKICGLKPGSELDILYENQRGWFFFGIPLYSDRSLLNIDPAPWMNADGKRSFVNITNAQVPDPSWEWAWRTWYVDMSGDVDEQGWQYAFSFVSSSWHGTYPFFHSFVRRRRWVRVRIKRASERHRRGQTGLEMGHMLNEDYFTIHSAVRSKRASSSERASRATRTSAELEEDGLLDEIKNIPTLMSAMKAAVVDREKLDTVKKFVEEGGDELYYLSDTIPEIMTRFVYQASRWQLLTYLKDVIQKLSQQEKQPRQEPGFHNRDTEGIRRKQEHLSKAAETAQCHLTGPEVLLEPPQSRRRGSAPDMMDLTPRTRSGSLLSRVSGRFAFKPIDNGGEMKGIPPEAEIGHDVHIY